MKNILVLCTGNSCRSQIAHGFLEHYTDDKQVKVYSAGVETHGVNTLAITTMKEAGLDIAHYTSNHVSEYLAIPFDLVITVCDNAKERCPIFPTKAKQLHHNFPDPAKAKGTADEVSVAFTQVRDMIRDYVIDVVKTHVEPEFQKNL